MIETEEGKSKMIRLKLALALAAAAFVAQAQDTSHGPQQLPTLRDRPSQQSTAAAVPATAAVITIHGLCSAPAAEPSACTTVITKDEYDRLMKALGQQASANATRELAQKYVQLMAVAEAGRKAGIESDPRFAEQVRLARLQILAQIYTQKLQEENSKPSADEIQAFYNQNASKFEQIKLSRIAVPANNAAAPNKAEWEKKAAQLANELRDRAAKGEDFEKLQKEAFTTLGLATNPPSTALGPRRRGMVPPKEEAELFSLKVGDVSQVEQEPSDYVIYKIENKDAMPLDQVKDGIARALVNQKMDSAIKATTASIHADFNEEYFGPAPAPPSTTPAPTLQRPPASPK
jgi:parvulin-like peptidyl-prolyl isomerase